MLYIFLMSNECRRKEDVLILMDVIELIHLKQPFPMNEIFNEAQQEIFLPMLSLAMFAVLPCTAEVCQSHNPSQIFV